MSEKVLLAYFVIFVVIAVQSNEFVNTLSNTLTKSLEFILEHNEFLDTNMLFGVAIVSGQVQVMEKYRIVGELRNEITKIDRLCENIFIVAFNQNVANIQNDKTQKVHLSPKLWSFDNPPRSLLDSSKAPLSSEEKAVLTWTEFRSRYEFCIRALIEQCEFSAKCLYLIVDYKSHGYELTHQILNLLILKQIMQQNLCGREFNFLNVNVDLIVNEKCSHAYTEIQFLEDEAHYNEVVADLLMEEVAVCALQNYGEFFQPKYIDFIINYPIPMNATILKQEDQLSLSRIIHLTSVRIAAIILYLKHAVQEEFL